MTPYEAYARVSELLRDSITLALIKAAQAEREIVTFIGRYSQAPEGSEYEMVNPFIVVQTPSEIILRHCKILTGACIEEYASAFIDGNIDDKSIRFCKQYIAEASNSGQLKDCSIITYKGTSENGMQYNGQWHSKSCTSLMKTKGDFSMRQVKDIGTIRTELEMICGLE